VTGAAAPVLSPRLDNVGVCGTLPPITNTQFVPHSRTEVLAIKREITESRLAYAREIGDKHLIAMNEAQLAKITEWERDA
jgi:hypothetical protein